MPWSDLQRSCHVVLSCGAVISGSKRMLAAKLRLALRPAGLRALQGDTLTAPFTWQQACVV
jgi:hypothetical protein